MCIFLSLSLCLCVCIYIYIYTHIHIHMVKNPAANTDRTDTGLIPGSIRSPGGGHGNCLQFSCPENPMDRGVWQATVHRVAKSRA